MLRRMPIVRTNRNAGESERWRITDFQQYSGLEKWQSVRRFETVLVSLRGTGRKARPTGEPPEHQTTILRIDFVRHPIPRSY
jgi:hypothetical protein